MVRLLLFACVVALAPGVAMAASFDCKTASFPREKIICADEELSRQDEEMAAAYHAVQKRLSRTGKDQMRRSQREWLRGLETAPADTDAISVLKGLYRHRIELLKKIGEAQTPAILVELHKADLPSHGWIHAVWPEFDGESPWVAEANETIRRLVVAWIPDDTSHSFQIDFSIGTSVSTQISMMMEFLELPTAESPWASYNRVFLNFNPSSGERISLASLFRHGVAWQGIFEAACRDFLGDTEVPVVLGGFETHALGISIECREKERQNDLPSMTTVPWKRLRPFLAPGVPMGGKR